MALDTTLKRRSALRQTLPSPDGTISAADRLQILWHYAGLGTVAPPFDIRRYIEHYTRMRRGR